MKFRFSPSAALALPWLAGLPLLHYPLAAAGQQQAVLDARDVPLITVDGLKFKDLNRDRSLNPYEDWRLPAAQRAADLVSRMTLVEKAGVMMHGSAPTADSAIGAGTHYDLAPAKAMIAQSNVNSLITRLSGDDPSQLAEENNKLQQLAEGSRLGIPLTISTDPRSSFQSLAGVSVSAGGFSRWPETTGLAAIGDEELVRRFADIVRQEYRAVGITEALSPQADLSTEPRWPRIDGTFGEDPALAKKMVRGYVSGMQNGKSGLNGQSVISVVKHWVGYGAARQGWDSHSAYGKYALFRTDSLRRHLEPFTGAFEARAAAVMPTYSILQGARWQGQPIEQVAAGFNRFLLTDLLRGEYGFDGVILSDWLITNDCKDDCLTGARPGEKPVPRGMPWGVEGLTSSERFIKALNAGIDQFGGVTDSAVLVKAVQDGHLSEARLDISANRILQQKFQTGLFERPYVDAARAGGIVGRADWQRLAEDTQARALVLLQNKDLLPLRRGSRVWLHGIDERAAREAGFIVVDAPEKADVALIRTHTPYEQPHKNFFFGRLHHEGALAFGDDHPDYQAIVRASARVPTLVTIYLDRPAILSNVVTKTRALVANFGISDSVLLSRLTSDAAYSARLPFELPSSMRAVLAQRSDLPYDSDKPLFPFGYGLPR